jgi:SAM-dependent methyltransferase
MVDSISTPLPSAWVERFAPLVSEGGTVLDVACGSGRHAALFVRLGHRVTAVDRDISRLAGTAGMEAIEADLEDGTPWPLPGCRFDGIVVTNYLHRPLFPVLVDSLAPGGVLIYETFALGNEKFGRPRDPEFLLRDNELLDLCVGKLTVIAYEGGVVDRPAPAVIQRIVAVAPKPDADAGPVAIPQPV